MSAGGRELSIGDLVRLPGLHLRVVAGSAALDRRISWLHVSELPDPTPWLDGGEVLLTSGLAVGSTESDQREYVARLAAHDVAGLAVGLGVVFDHVPHAIVDEAERLSFPTIEVPAITPFVAVTRAAHTVLTSERLASMTRALEVHEHLAESLVAGGGLEALLAITSERLGCGLSIVVDGTVLAEWHGQDRLPGDGAVDLPLQAGTREAVLRVATSELPLKDDMLIALAHARTVLSLELARRDAISATEMRLAGDLLDDMEHDRLDDEEIVRRMSAFGLDASQAFSAMLVAAGSTVSPEIVRMEISRRLHELRIPSLAVTRQHSVAFLVGSEDDQVLLKLARELVRTGSIGRVGIGRSATGRALGRSVVEARTALAALAGDVVSYRELGPLELLLALPDPTLLAFVQRVLSSVVREPALITSLNTLFATGWVWSEAARQLGVHRHTLRHRMNRVQLLANSDPDKPEERMELWLALKALAALEMRAHERPASPQ